MTLEQIAILVDYITAHYPRIDMVSTAPVLTIAPDGGRSVALWQNWWDPQAFDLSFASFKEG